MLAKAENRRSGGSLIAAKAFKDRAPVTDNVGKDVDLGIVPLNQAAVVPDLISRRQHYVIITDPIGCDPKGVKRYEAILFDFDGVIVDSEPIHYECWREILLPYGLDLDWGVYAEKGIGISDRAMLAMFAAEKDPPLDIEMLIGEYPRKKDMFRNRMLAEPSISSEVIELLESLRGAYKLAVVTSSGRNEVEPILEAAGILSKFDTAIYGGDVKRLKPAPDPYLLAAERLQIGRALVVEDSDAGVASGTAAGHDVLQVKNQAEMVERVRQRLESK
jgi:beta-phosphoglucomutase